MSSRFILVGLLLTLTGCVSSGPQTQYYSLFAAQNTPAESILATTSKNISIGVGPVMLPEYMDNPAIVNTLPSQQVRVSGRYAWAGNLKASVTRVVASDLSVLLKSNAISQFPWDTRIRPDYQLRIRFNRFNGVRGGKSELSANWVLIDTQSREAVITQSTFLAVESEDETVEAYVQALNSLLNRYAETVAAEITKHWQTSTIE